MVLLGVFVHDFGKALTPKEILPKHLGHEKRGLELVEDFYQKFQYGNKKVLLAFTFNHVVMHNALILNPKTVLKLLNKLTYKKDTFEKYLIMAQADAGVKLKKDFPNLKFLRDCAEGLKKINESDFFKLLRTKKRSLQMLHKKRISVVKNIKAEYNNL